MDHFICPSPDDLITPSTALVARFPEGGIFLLSGEMGAGKTTFVRSICEVLGASHVSSPTFSLINEYEGTGGITVIHMDLYRINSIKEALDFGFEEYLDRDGYLFIEWPEHVKELIGDEAKQILISSEPDGRHIRF